MATFLRPSGAERTRTFAHVCRQLCALLLLCTCLAGCFTYYPGGRNAPEAVALAEDAWPSRYVDILRPLMEATTEAMRALEAQARAEHETHGSRVVSARLAAGGLLRVYEPWSHLFESFIYGFERNASYMSSRWFKRFGEAALRDAAQSTANTQALVEAIRPGAELVHSTSELLLEEGLALRVPTRVEGERGLIVHLPAMVGNDFERSVMARLKADGWTILHVQSDTSVRGPGAAARDAADDARDARRGQILEDDPNNPFHVQDGQFSSPSEWTEAQHDAYRLALKEATRTAEAEIPMPETGFEIHRGDDFGVKGATIARYVDQHIADHAYAAQAAIGYIDDTLPALADRPIVVIGFSAGSLAAPTVAARLREVYPDRLSAVVLIGAGAPILDVAHLSTLTDGGLELTPEDAPALDEEAYTALRAQYLEASRLDPWHTASAIRDLPVLLIYGARDRMVPTSTGRALAERLGWPDRMIFPAGHMALFYFLPSQQDHIARWLRRHVE